jgi:hypothetical protein
MRGCKDEWRVASVEVEGRGINFGCVEFENRWSGGIENNKSAEIEKREKGQRMKIRKTVSSDRLRKPLQGSAFGALMVAFATRIILVVPLVMLCITGWSQLGYAQGTGIEPQADKLLRRMSDYLASRQQFTLKAESTLEAVLTSGQKLQYDSPATLMVSRPSMLRAYRKGDIADQEFFYDGKTLTLYNPKENLYATTAAPPTIDETLDFAREKLDIIAPAAELLYKNAAEKMLKVSTSGFVVGPSVVAGVKCTHLAFRGAEVDWQIWIEDGGRPLPRKFILTSKKVTGEPQFSVVIRSWDLAPKLTNQEFSFTPPKGAKKIEFLMLTAGAAKAK